MSIKQQVFYWAPVSAIVSVLAFVFFHLQLWAFSVLYRLAFYFHYLP
jgi:hypothetical protein